MNRRDIGGREILLLHVSSAAFTFTFVFVSKSAPLKPRNSKLMLYLPMNLKPSHVSVASYWQLFALASFVS